MTLSRRQFVELAGISGLALLSGSTLTGCSTYGKNIGSDELRDYKLGICDGENEYPIMYKISQYLFSYQGAILCVSDSNEAELDVEMVTDRYGTYEEASEGMIEKFSITSSEEALPYFVEKYGAKNTYSQEEYQGVLDYVSQKLEEGKQSGKTYAKTSR